MTNRHNRGTKSITGFFFGGRGGFIKNFITVQYSLPRLSNTLVITTTVVRLSCKTFSPQYVLQMEEISWNFIFVTYGIHYMLKNMFYRENLLSYCL